MSNTELPFWVQHTIITGREEGDEDKDKRGEEEEEEEEEHEEEGGDGDGGGTGDEDDQKTRADKLEKALEAERKLRRKAERDARRATKKTDEAEDQETKDLKQTQAELAKARERTTRLAERLLKKERDDAILAEARRQGFIDPTDALTDDIRNQVDVDQDEEDPSDIDVDLDSVKSAVTSLARRKKHLLEKPNEGEPSGSRIKRRAGESSEEHDNKFYEETYPSLR